MKLFFLTIALAVTLGAKASGLDFEYSENSLNISNQPLQVSGEFSRKNKNDQVSKLKRLRKQIEKRNEENVKKQIEKMRYMSEIKMMKRIQKAFDENLKNIDKI